MRCRAPRLLIRTLQGNDVFRLRSFQTFTDGEFDLLAFFQGLAAFADDVPEMNENIPLVLTRDEPITFLVIEPFDGPDSSIRHFFQLTMY